MYINVYINLQDKESLRPIMSHTPTRPVCAKDFIAHLAAHPEYQLVLDATFETEHNFPERVNRILFQSCEDGMDLVRFREGLPARVPTLAEPGFCVGMVITGHDDTDVNCACLGFVPTPPQVNFTLQRPGKLSG